MKKIYLFFILTFLFYLHFPLTSFSEEKPNPKKSFPANEKVKLQEKKKTYDEALKEYAKNRGEQLFSEGANFYKKGDRSKAIEKWTEALKLFRDANDRESQEITLGNIGNSFEENTFLEDNSRRNSIMRLIIPSVSFANLKKYDKRPFRAKL